MTLRSVPASSATLDPSILISTRHFGDEVGGMVAVTLYGLVLDCQACRQPTTALLAFVPNGDPAWDRHWVVLCNTEASLAVADTALPEIARIVNAVGRPVAGTETITRPGCGSVTGRYRSLDLPRCLRA